MREPLHFLSRGPLHLDYVNHLDSSQSKVQTQIALRHDAGAAMNFIHLDMFTSNNVRSCSYGRTIALGPDELQLDPILSIAPLIPQQ